MRLHPGRRRRRRLGLVEVVLAVVLAQQQLALRVLGLQPLPPRWRSVPPRRGAVRRSMGWGEPGWNWGYAVGEAHDLAAELRPRLGSQAQREAWLRAAVSPASPVPLDEAKLCLGLRVQRCGRSQAGPFNDVLAALVQGDFEGPDAEQAAQRLRSAVAPLLGEEYRSGELLQSLGGQWLLEDVAATEQDKARGALAAALVSLDFVRGGL